MRSDWTVVQNNFNMVSDPVHSGVKAMEAISGQIIEMWKTADPKENARYTMWMKLDAGSNNHKFDMRFRYIDSDNHYILRGANDNTTWRFGFLRIKNGTATVLKNYASSFSDPGFNALDGNWHRWGVWYYTDLAYIRIRCIHWNGSSWDTFYSLDEALGTGVLGAGHWGFVTFGNAGPARFDDFIIEDLNVTGP